MPSLRTEITEIVTGLATLGYHSIDRALEVRPRHITHVDDVVFERLEAARGSGSHRREFELAWDNGLAFARSDQGLRGRPPWTLEWKGHHRPASRSIETIPADLRVDHVYLISCKYGSQILHNSSPSQLFDHHLRDRDGTSRERSGADWYDTVAPEAYREVWEPVHRAAGLPVDVAPSGLDRSQRERLKHHLSVDGLDTSSGAYRGFVAAVSEGSAERWRASLRGSGSGGRGRQARQELLWRLLRMQAAPYFLLGATKKGRPLRYRVTTPWDFAQQHRVEALDVTAGTGGQPTVEWCAEIATPATGSVGRVSGYVEIRWSHGKLNGNPEAKVHLTTDPHLVPGYVPLTPGPDRLL